MKKYYFALLGIFSVLFSLYLLPKPIINLTHYFSEHAVKKTGIVESKYKQSQAFNHRYFGVSYSTYQTMYFVKISLNQQSRRGEYRTVSKFIIRKEFTEIKKGGEIEVYILPLKSRRKGEIDILLASTVRGSFWQKFFLSFKGDLTGKAPVLLLLLAGFLIFFVSTVLILDGRAGNKHK